MATKAEYTPGPWHVLPSEDKKGNKGCYINGTTGDVCDLYWYDVDELGQRVDLMQYDNAGANAHLIAAAPDLLNALNLLVCRHEGDEIGPEDIAEANAAITKATGDKPVKALHTLAGAKHGYYNAFTQPAEETGHPGDTLVFVGPFASAEDAVASDPDNARTAIHRVGIDHEKEKVEAGKRAFGGYGPWSH